MVPAFLRNSKNTMEFDSRQTIIAAILVLYLGRYMDRKFSILRKFNIPEAVSGGIVVAAVLSLIYVFFHIEVDFSMYYRDILLIIFFTTIGLATKLQTIIKGGRLFIIMMGLAVAFLFIQNFIGMLRE